MEKTIRVYEGTGIAKSYSKHRPTYPQNLWKKIFDFTEKTGVDTTLAVDLACGTGLSTFELCSRFQRTIGVDISQAQLHYAIEEAKTMNLNGEVEFVHASASKLPVQEESVDLLTCASAWHWLDPNIVFQEIDRVLKTPSALAVYGYCTPILHHGRCNEIFQDFMRTKLVWPDGPYGNTYNVSTRHYKDVRLPYPISEHYETSKQVTMSMEDISGMISSLPGHPDHTAVNNMIQEMKQVLYGEDVCKTNQKFSEITFHASIPYFMLLARKIK